MLKDPNSLDFSRESAEKGASGELGGEWGSLGEPLQRIARGGLEHGGQDLGVASVGAPLWLWCSRACGLVGEWRRY